MNAVLTPREMEAKCLDGYARQTGTTRDSTIDYMRGVISGRWGTVSQAGRDYARRVLNAMGPDLMATEQNSTRAPTYVEQTDFIYFECPECGFDSVQLATFKGSTACPLCAGDSGHDVGMSCRVARSTDKPEGRDARALVAKAVQS